MRSVRVSRVKLLEILTANRDKHRKTFEDACVGYREKAIAELDSMLADAKAGKKIRRSVTLIEPMDQTKDYDRVIQMLGMSVDVDIQLDEDDFTCYVLDEWRWKGQFTTISESYTSRR